MESEELQVQTCQALNNWPPEEYKFDFLNLNLRRQKVILEADRFLPVFTKTSASANI
jgi:hypothetical protein